jgi:hypothetical protein
MVAGMFRSLLVRMLLVVVTVGVIVATMPSDVAYADPGNGTKVTAPSKVKPIVNKGDDDG